MKERELPPLTLEQQELLNHALETITKPALSYEEGSLNPLEAWKTQYRNFAEYMLRQGKTLQDVNDILQAQEGIVPKVQ